MVLKQDLLASKTTTCHDTSKKAEQNQTATSLIGFSIGYVSKSFYTIIKFFISLSTL